MSLLVGIIAAISLTVGFHILFLKKSEAPLDKLAGVTLISGATLLIFWPVLRDKIVQGS